MAPGLMHSREERFRWVLLCPMVCALLLRCRWELVVVLLQLPLLLMLKLLLGCLRPRQRLPLSSRACAGDVAGDSGC